MLPRRYFRIADAAIYESLRMQLDSEWGHPTPDGETITCVNPAAVAPRDAVGRILLSVRGEFAEYEPAASMLPELLASGVVEEITAVDYQPVAPSE